MSGRKLFSGLTKMSVILTVLRTMVREGPMRLCFWSSSRLQLRVFASFVSMGELFSHLGKFGMRIDTFKNTKAD